MFVGNRTRKSDLFAEWERPDDAEILRLAEQALEHPRDAAFWDDDLYSTHTLMFYSAPDSDDMISQSNYATILRDLSAAYSRAPGAIESASIRHWTYSRFDCVRIRVTYANGEIHPAFADAVTIQSALNNYPLWDEDDHSEREYAEWDRAISDAVEWELRDSDDAEQIRDDVIAYLYSDAVELIGYHDVGYVPDETLSQAIDAVRHTHAAAQSAGLSSPSTAAPDPLF